MYSASHKCFSAARQVLQSPYLLVPHGATPFPSPWSCHLLPSEG